VAQKNGENYKSRALTGTPQHLTTIATIRLKLLGTNMMLPRLELRPGGKAAQWPIGRDHNHKGRERSRETRASA